MVIGLLLLCALPGCVSRRLTIRSNPPGAMVYIDDQEIGVTPVSTSYIYYGGRKIRLVRDGFETVTVIQEIPAPWYQYFPIEFVADNVVPWEIRDERTLDFTLTPQQLVHPNELQRRAQSLRDAVQASAAPPPGASVPPGLPVGPAPANPAPSNFGAPAPRPPVIPVRDRPPGGALAPPPVP